MSIYALLQLLIRTSVRLLVSNVLNVGSSNEVTVYGGWLECHYVNIPKCVPQMR